MKKLIYLLMLGLSACAGGSGGQSGPAPVVGVDISGSYSLDGVVCVNPQGSLTSTSFFNPGYTSVVTVVGNSFTEVNTSGSCVVEAKGYLEAKANGYLDLKNMTVTRVEPVGCLLNSSLQNTDISPSTFSRMFYVNERLPDVINILYGYAAEDKTFAMLTVMTDAPDNFCFNSYQGQ